jgi:hypothetical protein
MTEYELLLLSYGAIFGTIFSCILFVSLELFISKKNRSL